MNTTTIEFNPAFFNLSDSKKGFLSDANKATVKKISSSIKNKKQLLLVVGEKGSGKTTLVQRAIGELKPTLLFINITEENLDFEGLINHTGDHLKDGFPTESSVEVKSAHLKVLIKTKSIKHVIFLINQSLTEKRATLESAIKLVNSNLFGRCSSHLIITGQADLEAKLRDSNLLISEINSFHVDPLSKSDTLAYINFHLNQIDQGDRLFSKAAIERIIRYSKGRPLLINRLCEQGMMMANIEEASSVTEDMVNEVLENSVFLNNEFDYEAPELEQSPPAPFLNSFNQAAVSAQPTKKNPTLPDDFFSNLEASPPIPPAPARKKKPVKKQVVARPTKPLYKPSPTPMQQQPKAARVAKPHVENVVHVNKPNPRQEEEKKSAGVSIFAMGMVTSAIIGSTWYYFDQQSPNLLEEPIATVGNTRLNLPKENQTITPLKTVQNRPTVIERKGKLEPTPKEKTIYQKVAATKKGEVASLVQKEVPVKAIGNVVASAQKITQPQPVKTILPKVEAKPTSIKIEKPALSVKPPLPIQDKTVAKAESSVTQKPVLAEQQLLQQAKRQLISKQLMSPDNDNAWTTYKKVLELNPNNKLALEGIFNIKEVYMGWAREKINNGNDIHALHYLNKASKIAPNDPEVLAAFSKIQKTAVAKSRSFNPQLDTRLYRLIDAPTGVSELLKIADEQIAEKNLTKPVSSSAYSIYQLILNRFPNHPQALKGVEKIKTKYLGWARYEIKHGGSLSHAEYLYTKALEISPSDPEIMSDLDQLRETTKPL